MTFFQFLQPHIAVVVPLLLAVVSGCALLATYAYMHLTAADNAKVALSAEAIRATGSAEAAASRTAGTVFDEDGQSYKAYVAALAKAAAVDDHKTISRALAEVWSKIMQPKTAEPYFFGDATLSLQEALLSVRKPSDTAVYIQILEAENSALKRELLAARTLLKERANQSQAEL